MEIMYVAQCSITEVSNEMGSQNMHVEFNGDAGLSEPQDAHIFHALFQNLEGKDEDFDLIGNSSHPGLRHVNMEASESVKGSAGQRKEVVSGWNGGMSMRLFNKIVRNSNRRRNIINISSAQAGKNTISSRSMYN